MIRKWSGYSALWACRNTSPASSNAWMGGDPGMPADRTRSKSMVPPRTASSASQAWRNLRAALARPSCGLGLVAEFLLSRQYLDAIDYAVNPLDQARQRGVRYARPLAADRNASGERHRLEGDVSPLAAIRSTDRKGDGDCNHGPLQGLSVRFFFFWLGGGGAPEGHDRR